MLNAGGVVQSQTSWWGRRRVKENGGGASFDWGYVKDEGGSRGDVEVAGTGGKTAGGEGIRKKNVVVRAQTGCFIKHLDDALMTRMWKIN